MENYCQAIESPKMEHQIRVNPKTRLAYIAKELITDGFVGDLDVYGNAKTVTSACPGTSLEDVERSLHYELVLSCSSQRYVGCPCQK